MVRLFIWSNGAKWWWLEYQHHRANGPAIVWANGKTFWYWRGRPVTEFEHMILVEQELANG